MIFKHAFHVFVDNFSSTYKMLVYRLIVAAITAALSCAVILPVLNNLLSTAQFEQLRETFSSLWADIIALNTENLHGKLEEVMEAGRSFISLISEKSWLMAILIIGMLLVYLISRFLVGVGNYVTGALINDRMTLHAKSPFTMTMIKNLGKACLYSIIYAPLALLYDVVGFTIVWAIVFVGLKFVPLGIIKVFLTAVLVITLYAIKFTLTANWLPAVVHAKQNNRKAMKYTFKQGAAQFGGVLSTALVLMLIIIALNVAATFFTLGAGLLLTVPASQLMLSSYQFVNYFDGNKLKYFVDEYTVIGPKKETPVSREEFFKGED